MSVTKGRRMPVVLLAAASAVVLTAVALSVTVPSPVKTTARNEIGPAAGDDWFAWSRSRAKRPSRFDLYAERAGGRPFRVNKGGQPHAGGIDGTQLVYQQVRGSLADLRLFDLATRRHKPLASGINTRSWECCGTISGDWLLFSRGRAYRAGRQLVLLRNLVTGEQRVLDALQSRKGLLRAGQLNGTFGVWARCDPYPRCRVFRYDIATGSATVLPVEAGKITFAPSVNQYGTAYYLQRERGCGKAVQLMKQPVMGPSQLLASLPQDRDVGISYAHSASSKPPRELVRTRIYFDQRACGKRPKWDIYRVDDTERVPGPYRATITSSKNSPARRPVRRFTWRR